MAAAENNAAAKKRLRTRQMLTTGLRQAGCRFPSAGPAEANRLTNRLKAHADP
jgi:hypothetical protein